MVQLLRCLLLVSAVQLCTTARIPRETHGDPDAQCPLTVKILDAVKGTPAASVSLNVSRKGVDGEWTQIAQGVTDMTGEVHNFVTEEAFTEGVYSVWFDTKTYWKNAGSTPFYEGADVVFEAHAEGHRHYTIALLISPYSYTTTALFFETQH